VFLHGFSFTSDVWQRAGATELLKEKHVPFLALDMPYGARSECHTKTRDSEVNVAVVREAIQEIFGAVLPVLVGASLGGMWRCSTLRAFLLKDCYYWRLSEYLTNH
jgi:pimeloyl-ACP methyl ester carboxylesterase